MANCNVSKKSYDAFFIAITVFDMLAFKFVTLKMSVKVKGYNIRNGPIRCQISTSIKVILEHFLLTRTVFKIRDLENVDQSLT